MHAPDLVYSFGWLRLWYVIMIFLSNLNCLRAKRISKGCELGGWWVLLLCFWWHIHEWWDHGIIESTFSNGLVLNGLKLIVKYFGKLLAFRFIDSKKTQHQQCLCWQCIFHWSVCVCDTVCITLIDAPNTVSSSPSTFRQPNACSPDQPSHLFVIAHAQHTHCKPENE